ncbi:MAG: hypothetical protein P4L87_11450 [Formivibrio sp.]|nr:hypothetical protein [Formivibrio sp.]
MQNRNKSGATLPLSELAKITVTNEKYLTIKPSIFQFFGVSTEFRTIGWLLPNQHRQHSAYVIVRTFEILSFIMFMRIRPTITQKSQNYGMPNLSPETW